MTERKKNCFVHGFGGKEDIKESERKRPKMVKNLHTKAKKKKKERKKKQTFSFCIRLHKKHFTKRERERKHECTREKKR